MKELTFADLARLPVIAGYERSFRMATGVSLKLVPAGEPASRLTMGEGESPLCALLTGTPTGCDACHEVQRRALRMAGKRPSGLQITCFAGLTDVAVPVNCEGRHLATLISGQVFRRAPTERDFQLVRKIIKLGPDPRWEADLRQAYFATPVVTPDRFEAILHLLGVFARYISEHASKQALASAADEPPAITGAKKFVEAHAEEPLTLAQVVRHVNVSRFYFCKMFRKATGMTLTEYINRVRVEKAKGLLADRSLRVSEVVFAAGFGSIPQFNSVFKRHVGIAPSEYRDSLKNP